MRRAYLSILSLVVGACDVDDHADGDPAAAALAFVAAHDDASFTVTRVDVEPALHMRHVTLQRTVDGIPTARSGARSPAA